jgi:hypothetical protein
MVIIRLPVNHRSRNAKLAGLYRTRAGPLPIRTGREWSLFHFPDWFASAETGY